MTPRYLSHQLAQSLRNMNLEAVDVYYVHNPETQLQVIARDEFDRRLRAAFEQLERERAEGRLRFYGAATWNGFRVQEGARGHHSVERMIQLAATRTASASYNSPSTSRCPRPWSTRTSPTRARKSRCSKRRRPWA
jgi:aryl-alcohol dehydrogenase-like predicted oxidoreductase